MVKKAEVSSSPEQEKKTAKPKKVVEKKKKEKKERAPRKPSGYNLFIREASKELREKGKSKSAKGIIITFIPIHSLFHTRPCPSPSPCPYPYAYTMMMQILCR